MFVFQNRIVAVCRGLSWGQLYNRIVIRLTDVFSVAVALATGRPRGDYFIDYSLFGAADRR